MSRKHFEAIAAAIRKLDSQENRELVARAMLPALSEANARFDTDRFLRASGVTEEPQ